MKINRTAMFAVAALACVLCVAPAFADTDNGHGWDRDQFVQQQQRGIVWRGVVDDVVNVYVRGGQVWSEVRSGNPVDDESFRVVQPLPDEHTHIWLDGIRGRGKVYVFQEPSRRNGYTTGIRIEDHQPGSSFYRFALAW